MKPLEKRLEKLEKKILPKDLIDEIIINFVDMDKSVTSSIIVKINND